MRLRAIISLYWAWAILIASYFIIRMIITDFTTWNYSISALRKTDISINLVSSLTIETRYWSLTIRSTSYIIISYSIITWLTPYSKPISTNWTTYISRSWRSSKATVSYFYLKTIYTTYLSITFITDFSLDS